MLQMLAKRGGRDWGQRTFGYHAKECKVTAAPDTDSCETPTSSDLFLYVLCDERSEGWCDALPLDKLELTQLDYL